MAMKLPLIPGARPSQARFETLSWLTLAATIAYLGRNALGVAESSIREELDLSITQSGWLMSSFFWTYALFQVPSGWFAQRRGTRLALSLFALVWSFGLLLMGMAPVAGLLIAAQMFMGIAQAGLFPAACNSVMHWMPLSRRSFSCGLLAAGMQVGAITAAGLTGRLIEPLGWRWVYVLYAIPGILWAWGFLFRFQDDPEKAPGVNADELALIREGKDIEPKSEKSDEAVREPTPWGAIASNSTVWFLCGQQACRASGYMFFASWFPTFLQKTRGISVADSGILQALTLTGTFTGAIFGGLLADSVWRKTQNLRLSRCGVAGCMLFCCALLILSAWTVESVNLAVALLALGSFFAALAGPCAYTATIDVGGRHVPQVFGLMNMCGNLSAAACPILVGYLFSRTENWNLVLLVFAAVYFTGAICWAFIDPRRKIS
ncbi:MAG: ACS family D-galactonate transporter-like MFS transporter [Candidatus Binatia bacterium]|jgi:ACS family D-galactonate transporter-like MFS transporter